MKNIYTRIIVFTVLISLFVTGCSVFQKTTESELAKESESSNENTIAKINIDNMEVGSLEKQIVGQMMGGFFYTVDEYLSNDDEIEFTRLRKESIAILNNKLNTVINNGFLVSDGFEKYEDILFKYMDEIQDDTNDKILKITEGVLSNRILRNSLKKQFETFNELKSADDLINSTISRNIFENTCELVVNHKDYLSWLMDSTEVVALILSESDEQKSLNLITECTDSYKNDMDLNYENMLKDYIYAAKIYTYIISADCHNSEYILNSITENINMMDEDKKDSIKEIIQKYNEILTKNRKSPIIIETSMENNKVQLYLANKPKFMFSTIAYATENYDKYFSNTMALGLLMIIMESELPINEEDNEFLLEDMLLNEELTSSIMAGYERQRSNENDLNIRRRIIDVIKTNNNSNEINGEDLSNIKEEIKYMESSSTIKINRQAIIDKITDAQSVLDSIGAFGSNAQYSMMISMINSLIKSREDISDEKIKNISNLINNDLAEIIGDKKEEFFDRIISLQAEEIINIFDDWKKNTNNFNEFNFNKDDLIRLINSLGVVTEVTSLETETDFETKQNSTPEETNKSTEPIIRGLWKKVKTEEIIPSTYEVGDDKDNRKYTFEYSQGLINCNYIRIVYDGIKKTHMNETIETSGGWALTNDDGEYMPEQKVRVTLSAEINEFKRLTTAESGGTGTNQAGVAVWAYIGNIKTPFGNATSGVFEDENGESVCRASIMDGKIEVPTASMEVSGVFGQGKDEDKKVLFVVVSNQGRIGGIKYTYQYVE